ncbi:MAG: diflavin oxidoreductase [Gammaproteobacteria bacterium]
MLHPPDLQTVEQLRRRLKPAQLAWLGGYFSAAAGEGVAPFAAVGAADMPDDESQNVAVLYGSQTGNGKKVADALVGLLQQRGVRAVAMSMENYKTARLKKEKKLFAVVSTHGEGEPPDAAAAFLAFLQSNRAPRLDGLRFAVLALGDSSYEHFCKTGRDLHNYLQKLGAMPILDIAECDADYETAARKWREDIADKQGATINGGGVINGATNGAIKSVVNGANNNTPLHAPVIAAGGVDINAPFAAEVLANIKISGEGRNVRHLELSLAGSNLRPQPGDSIGIAPHNDKKLALLVCKRLGLQPDAQADIDGEVATAGEWLEQKLDISRLTAPVLQRFAAIVNDRRLNDICAERQKIVRYINGRGLLEVLDDIAPPKNCGIEIMKTLRRLTPRLYSLASAREDEAHLLVADAAYYDAGGRLRRGVCSDYLSALATGDSVRVFVQDNETFRPPQDANTPIIMIGAGAGVAPFRAFMEEREEMSQSGEAWLFFGERRRREDFYYQREWLRRLPPSQGGLANGGGAPLAKLSAAFSRDGGGKVYVQHKLYENAEQVRRWIDNGASVYVCGDDKGMGRDVHNALADIAGAETLATLQREKRYRRDVY